jgi:hypothetical protein
MLRCVRDTDMQLGRLAPTRIIPEVMIIMILVRELARGLESPNLLFLCGWYRRALAGCHRLASGLVRPRKDTHCLRSSSDRWAGKCGGKCGVSASDRLRVNDVHGCDDSFRVSDLRHT